MARFDAALARLAEEMIDAMHRADGIGLAAQQVGRALQLCVIDLRGMDDHFSWRLDASSPPLELIMPLALVNPEVTVRPEPVTRYEEGCLSFPEIRGEVLRPDWVSVRFQDLHGHPHELECDGLFGRCIQHEVDHLNGVLFIDRMEPGALDPLKPAIDRLQRATAKARSR